jgi:hypothetical protein
MLSSKKKKKKNKKSSKRSKNIRTNQNKNKNISKIFILIIIVLFLIIVVKDRKKKIKDNFYVKQTQTITQTKETFNADLKSLLDKDKVITIKNKDNKYLKNDYTLFNNTTDTTDTLENIVIILVTPETLDEKCTTYVSELNNAKKTLKTKQDTITASSTNENKTAVTEAEKVVAEKRLDCAKKSAKLCRLLDGKCEPTNPSSTNDPYDGKIYTIAGKEYLFEKHPTTKNSYAFRLIEPDTIRDTYFGINAVTGTETDKLNKDNKQYWTVNTYDFKTNDKSKNEFLLDIAKNINLDILIKDESNIDIELYNYYYQIILDKILVDVKSKEKFEEEYPKIYKYDKFMNRILIQINSKFIKTIQKNSLFKKIKEIYTIIIDNNMHTCCELYKEEDYCNGKKSTCTYKVDRCGYVSTPSTPNNDCDSLISSIKLINKSSDDNIIIGSTQNKDPNIDINFDLNSNNKNTKNNKESSNNKNTKNNNSENDKIYGMDKVVFGSIVGGIILIVIVVGVMLYIKNSGS